MTTDNIKSGSVGIAKRSKRDTSAPRLLGELERRRINRLLNEAEMSVSPLVVIAPAPIIGFRSIEEIQEIVGGTLSAPAAADYESWAANPRNMVDFLETLLRNGVDKVAILSGDVHYAFEVASSISTSGDTLKVAQFCSSAMKNKPTGFQRLGSRFLRKLGASKNAVAWWDFKSGDDGAITRYHAVNDLQFKALERAHGKPSFIVTEKLNERDGNLVHLFNNAGQLHIDEGGIRHRFWRSSGNRFAPDHYVDWEWSNWPVERLWL